MCQVLINTKIWFSKTNELSGSEISELFDCLIKKHNNCSDINFTSDFIKETFISLYGVFTKNTEQLGESHWNWKNGVSTENNIIRSSSQYKKWRKSVFYRDNFTCMICDKKGGVLNAHHLIPFSINKDLRLDLENGITLCKSCHIELHKNDRPWL